MGVILKVKNLTKSFGDVRAVNDVSFEINEGELVSIIGANGAGKTTLLNIISGFLKPDGGEIIFNGKNIVGLPPPRLVKEGIVRSFQLLKTFDNLTTYESMKVALISKFNRTTNMLSLVNKDDEIAKEAKNVLKIFNLYDKRDILVENLAHGDKKLLDVATAYALEPKLLLLDEPTSGVSSREKYEIMEIINSTVKRGGITTVIVEHDMDVVFSYSNRVIAMAEGKIIAEGSPEEVKSNKEVIERVIGLKSKG